MHYHAVAPSSPGKIDSSVTGSLQIRIVENHAVGQQHFIQTAVHSSPCLGVNRAAQIASLILERLVVMLQMGPAGNAFHHNAVPGFSPEGGLTFSAPFLHLIGQHPDRLHRVFSASRTDHEGHIVKHLKSVNRTWIRLKISGSPSPLTAALI